MPHKTKKVQRFDNVSPKAFYTEEGYLRDNPILTSVGIFEYTNADGSLRRELRLPEEVFDPESLASYRGKPIIITHDAGLMTKDNVHANQIGTILSKGHRDGDDVRAEIIIHDTDEMKRSHLKELSLGYNLDLDETPGTWKGEHYDAIQRNIRINHLALVREARAGDQARLNVDGRDSNVLKGGHLMTPKKNRKRRTRRADGILSPEELKNAVAAYKARRAQRLAAKDADDTTDPNAVPASAQDDDDTTIAPSNTDPKATAQGDCGTDPTTVAQDEDAPVEDRVAAVKENRDRRDEQGDPQNLQQANGVIAKQDEDISCLFDIIDTLLAEKEFDDADETDQNVPTGDDDDTLQNPENQDDDDLDPDNQDDDDLENQDDDDLDPDNQDDDDDLENQDDDDDLENQDDDDEFANQDDDDDLENDDDDDDDLNADDDDDPIPSADPSTRPMNADSIDRMVRARVKIDRCARKLHMDGLGSMPIQKAKRKVIRRVRPSLRLDGKSAAYINAAFDQAYDEIERVSRKGTDYQKRQMFHGDSKRRRRTNMDSATAARNKMIKRHQKAKKHS